jgi:serine phosphatase RsbU (regulator of sigma subunit)/catechol 2,3-dioxygenase-like lactoylglutathione lyase family enzyme
MENWPANQSPGDREPRNPYLRIQGVNIFVRDQERSLKFYVDQLGFRLDLDVRLPNGKRLIAVAPPDGTCVLRLIAANPDSERDSRLLGRPTQVTFLTDDVVAKVREWTRRGVRFVSAPRLRRVQRTAPDPPGSAPVWGGMTARFTDVDGNSFSLVGYDEVSRKIEAHRRAAAERQEAERRAAQELEIARQVQGRLFPQSFPQLRTLEYAGACVQARQVGGDYYDFLNLGQDRVGFVLADVAGKGIAAALLMANLQANLRSQCAVACDQPQRFLESVNQLFYDNTAGGAYTTLFFGEYDDSCRRLRYVNCGHLAALLLRGDDHLERLESTGTVLGLFQDWTCALGESHLAPGDVLALYTDGVTESFDENGSEFGEARLAAALRQHRQAPPQELLASLLDSVKQFSAREQFDDLTLILARGRED